MSVRTVACTPNGEEDDAYRVVQRHILFPDGVEVVTDPRSPSPPPLPPARARTPCAPAAERKKGVTRNADALVVRSMWQD